MVEKRRPRLTNCFVELGPRRQVVGVWRGPVHLERRDATQDVRRKDGSLRANRLELQIAFRHGPLCSVWQEDETAQDVHVIHGEDFNGTAQFGGTTNTTMSVLKSLGPSSRELI